MSLKHKGLEFEAIPWRYSEKEKIAFTGSTTVPVIVDGNRAVYDSFEIAVYLDEAYPSRPGLFEGTESRALGFFMHHWAVGTLHPPLLRAVIMDLFGQLHEKDRAYFRETREKRLGGRLEDIAADQKKWLAQFRGALEPLRSRDRKLQMTPWPDERAVATWPAATAAGGHTLAPTSSRRCPARRQRRERLRRIAA